MSKSIKIRQADKVLHVTDQHAGLAEGRRNEGVYNRATEKVVKRVIARTAKEGCWQGPEDDENGSSTGDDDMPKDEDEDDQGIRVDLGDEFTDSRQTHHHRHEAPAPSQPATRSDGIKLRHVLATGAILAGMGTGLGGLGLGGLALYNSMSGDDVSAPAGAVPDSEYDVLFFDKDGNPIYVKRITEAPDDVQRNAGPGGSSR